MRKKKPAGIQGNGAGRERGKVHRDLILIDRKTDQKCQRHGFQRKKAVYSMPKDKI
jgi:hypothetical protein